MTGATIRPAIRARRTLAFAVAWLAAAPIARADRPVLAGEMTFGAPGGELLVHYATVGVDAVRPDDADRDGVPDFVAQVATTAELALGGFVAIGFRRPLSDGTLGGDGRIDLYLRDLRAADGNASIDVCDGVRCIGYVSAENDYAGYAYASITEAIRSVVPHEVFHLVQNAYASDQPASWTEGTAVWSVEHLFGAGNSDFERFLPAFLTRSFRPFERTGGGFGDGYPYGAALWPYFLEQRFGVGVVVAAWAACEHATFLDAIDEALASSGSSSDDAWTELTRWNVFTGARAAVGAYPDAAAWPAVPREPAIAEAGTLYVEGLSARYVPITAAARSQLTVAATGGIRIAAWIVADGGDLEDGTALAPSGAALATTLEPGAYTLVVTGLSRGTITTAVDVALAEPDDGGGCASTRGSGAATLLLVAALVATRSSRACRARGTARRSPWA